MILIESVWAYTKNNYIRKEKNNKETIQCLDFLKEYFSVKNAKN